MVLSQCNSKISLTLFITSITSKGHSHRRRTADETKHSCEVGMIKDGGGPEKSEGKKIKRNFYSSTKTADMLHCHYAYMTFSLLLTFARRHASCLEKVQVTWGWCIRQGKLWEFDSSSLIFKIISIHYKPSCCHLASQHSAAVRGSGSESKVWMALTLYCSCPLASFHSHLCVKHLLWSGATFISLFNRCNQTALLCKWWAHAGEHEQAFQIEHFQRQCQV